MREDLINWKKIYTPEDLEAARAAPDPEPKKKAKRRWWPGKQEPNSTPKKARTPNEH